MSRRIRNIIIIEGEPEGLCHLCGKVAETRPYGPGFQEICYECSLKDEAATRKRMYHKLFGESISPEDIGEL